MDTKSIISELRKRHGIADDTPLAVDWKTADFDDEEGDSDAFTARINVDTLDRDNEVVLPQGVDLRDFDKSGAGFFNHDYDRLPVFVPGPVKMMGKTLVGKGRFLKNEFAQDVKDFVRAMSAAGKSAGVSIGFMPIDERKPTKKDISTYGESVKRVFTKWKLLEWSIAPVQSNPEAMVTEIGKSLRSGVAKSLYGVEVQPAAITAPEPLQPIARRKIYIVLQPPRPVRRRAKRTISTNDIVNDAARRAVAKMQGQLYL